MRILQNGVDFFNDDFVQSPFNVLSSFFLHFQIKKNEVK